MNIENIIWRNVMVSHQTRKKDFKNKKTIFKLAEIAFSSEDKCVTIYGTETGNWSWSQSHLYANPKLLKLTPNSVEIEAEWWRTSFKNKKPKHYKNHKILITASF